MVCVSDCFVRAGALRVMVCQYVFRLLCQASCTVGARRPSTWTGVWLCFPVSICVYVCERERCVCVRDIHTYTHIFSNDKRCWLQSNEANYIDLNAGTGIRLKPPCFPPVTTLPAAGQAESLWDCSGGRWGLQLSTEPSAALGSSSSTSDEDDSV